MGDDSAEKYERIHELLARVDRHEPDAFGDLVAVVYPELKRLAHFQLTREQPGHTLNTTAIVHEAYVRMASGAGRWDDRKHFLRAASAVMRHLLVDHARRKRADKRGSGNVLLELEESRVEGGDDSLAVLALDNALKDIAEIDPRLEQIIECRYFAGLSIDDTAEALGMSVRTVERDVQRARAYLVEAMGPDEH
ncbi:ECF-type sigma factor [Wenzhouxiangella sp. XN24]|uniref:ECF-type sigma factor n=1 Tax=Wenzhouxiangella sp. XN24 TaxID=2713569 RepID=UPI0013ED471E|nr:ECF-type sigma factor [Wenzhouxiangella sp. XN24]NGX16317.1 sigma-70 family RNA polymerase sigma factor [Wenzhouxiangella sp. XN24]